MQLIRLTNGGFAVVDNSDYWIVKRFKWCRMDAKGGLTYAMRTTTDEPREMHRAIIGVENGRYNGKKLQIHHRDNNGLNNCKSNLRIVLPGKHQAAHCSNIDTLNIGVDPNRTGYPQLG